MTSYLVVGSKKDFEEFVEEFVKKEKIDEFFIKRFDETVKIDEARNIKSELSFQQTAKRLFLVTGGMTHEAQNALLKTLEELGDASSFIFYAKSREDFLPTINSRCMVKVFSENEVDDEFVQLFNKTDTFTYNEIEIMSEMCKKDIKRILPSLRKLLLDESVSKEKKADYYMYCKRLLLVASLTEINNVNEKVILENVFL